MAARSRTGSRSIYLYQDLKKDARLFRRLKCITGHGLKPFVDFREYESRLRWFTFLRDPKKRFISHYIHQQTSDVDHY